MRLLVVGRSGQVARGLMACASSDVELIAVGRPELDLEQSETITAALARVAPDAVACVGAYTQVDAAESDEARATRVNAEGPGVSARACAERGVPMYYVSTDYVFDGAKVGAYLETDATNPQSVYGRSKLAGERAVLAAGGAVLRTSWVYDAEGTNFVRTMLRLAQTRDELSVVADQIGRPTYAPHLAQAIVKAAQQRASGVVHVAGGEACAWATLAEAIFAASAARGGPSARVRPVTTEEYRRNVQQPAARPMNSVLDVGKAEALGLAMPSYRAALNECLDRIAASAWPT